MGKFRYLLTLLVPVFLFAQSERGNITGQIKDSSGAAIAGAEVTAVYVTTNVQTNTRTTEAGEYNLPAAPGVYRVTIAAPGFKRYVRDNVTLATATSVRLDAILELGG